ncbi:hypothetical protein STEG23_018789, partial [Scotinomys teguina]
SNEFEYQLLTGRKVLVSNMVKNVTNLTSLEMYKRGPASFPEEDRESLQPVPGSLSSLLHLHNRQRQPMPASMPGTLPNPTMPGSSAVLMPMERQMSVNSSIMGMQGPNLSNPCASPQVQPMHSEAKM